MFQKLIWRCSMRRTDERYLGHMMFPPASTEALKSFCLLSCQHQPLSFFRPHNGETRGCKTQFLCLPQPPVWYRAESVVSSLAFCGLGLAPPVLTPPLILGPSDGLACQIRLEMVLFSALYIIVPSQHCLSALNCLIQESGCGHLDVATRMWPLGPSDRLPIWTLEVERLSNTVTCSAKDQLNIIPYQLLNTTMY